MKIVLVSDTHGYNDILYSLQERYSDSSLFIHCGDLEEDPLNYPGWLIVRGNNDYWGDFKDHLILRAGGHRILVFHSQFCGYFHRNEALKKEAQKYDCDIVFYGHTHVSAFDQEDGITLINPGSLRYPRQGQSPRFAIVEINEETIQVHTIFLEDILR